MTVVDALIVHFLATPVVFVVLGVAAWLGVVKRQRTAFWLALFAAIPTIAVSVALLSESGWSVWWYVAFGVAAAVVVVFVLSSLGTNKLSASIQIGCLAILPFFGALVLIEGVGIVFLWSWLLMIAALGFSSSEWPALDAGSHQLKPHA